MAINVTLSEAKTQKEKPYPKLMIRKEGERYSIIIATIQTVDMLNGVIIATNNELDFIGKPIQTVNVGMFTDYNEPITLQNQ